MGTLLLVILGVGLAAMLLRWQLGRSEELLETWAAEEGYTLLEVERRYLMRGPFFWRSGKGHEVFHVVVRTPSGATRSGFVRVGGWFLGLASNAVSVEWD